MLSSGVGLFACMFLANELPLRHLLAKIYGETVGPQGFSGPNGRLFASCENLPIVKFEPTGEFNLDIKPSHPSTDKCIYTKFVVLYLVEREFSKQSSW